MPRPPSAPRANPPAPAAAGEPASRIVELRASANLMLLDAGLYCLFQEPGQIPAPQDGSGLPGVRVTLAPNGGQPGAVSIRGLHDDGWLGPRDGAALVQVRSGPAQILVTVYQSPTHAAESAPRLKVVRLESEAAHASAAPRATADAAAGAAVGAGAGIAVGATAGAIARPARLETAPPVAADVVAHIQRAGDVGVAFGDWLGQRGSKLWVEGFGLEAPDGVAPDQIEYQAVLGRGWLSPWVTAGKFCGSRGMALPLLGLNIRLLGAAAGRYDCSYSASFVDGSAVGPIPAGQTCDSPNLAPLEAFQIVLSPKAPAKTGPAAKAPTMKTPTRKTPTRKVAAGKMAGGKVASPKRPAGKSPAPKSAPRRR